MSDLFHYSSLNHELAQSTPSGSINILWNQLGEKMKADSIMFMTPNFDPSIGFTYPEFGMWGNNLLDPMLAIQQTMQSFQNGSWMNNIGGGGSLLNNMPWNNNNWSNNWLNNMPWNNNNNNNNNSSVSSNPQYDALKALLTRYKELNPNDSKISDIDEAINKSGTAEEKMEALKKVYKKLSKSKLQKALLDLPEYKKILDSAGYNFNGMNKDDDKKLRVSLSNLHDAISTGKADWGGTVNPASDEDDILRVISYWNDTYHTESERGIVRMIANNLPDEVEQRTMHKDYAEKLASALTERAAEFKAEFEGTFPKLDAAIKEVNDASAKIKDNKTCTKDNLKGLANAFDKLYAMLRMMEAEKVRNTIQAKYSFLNDISSTDTDFVTDDLVINATKEDLKNEGITVVETDAVPKEEVAVEEPGEKAEDDKVDCPEDPEEALEWLADEKQGYLGETKKEGVYTTKTVSTTGEKARFYKVKDGKLVELTNIKEIKDDGTIVKIDDTKAEDESKVVMDDTINDSADIIDYSTAVKTIEDYKKADKLKKVTTPITGLSAGTVVYASKGKDEAGNSRYFIIRNNKLMKINGVLYTTGKVKQNGTEKNFADLTDDDFSEVTAADFEKTTPTPAPASTPTTEEETTTTEKNTTDEDTKVKSETIKQSDIDMGTKVADLLMTSTNNTEWASVEKTILGVNGKDNLPGLNADNIKGFMYGYEKKNGIGADCILEQIQTECKDGFWNSVLYKFRPAKERLALMNKVLKATLDYAKNNIKNYEKDENYKYLKSVYNDGKGIKIDGEIVDLDRNSICYKLRKADAAILNLLGIQKISPEDIESEESENN